MDAARIPSVPSDESKFPKVPDATDAIQPTSVSYCTRRMTVMTLSPIRMQSAAKSRLHTIISDNSVSQETAQANTLFWLEMRAWPVHCLWSRRGFHFHQDGIEPVHQSEKTVRQK